MVWCGAGAGLHMEACSEVRAPTLDAGWCGCEPKLEARAGLYISRYPMHYVAIEI